MILLVLMEPSATLTIKGLNTLVTANLI